MRHVTRIGWIAAVLLAVAVVAHSEEKQMTPLDIPMIGDVEALKPGDAAPPFTLKNTEGTPFDFNPAAGKAHLLVFWSIFCEPCRAEMPLIQSLYDKYTAKGFEVISVALDGDMAEAIGQFAKQGKYTFTVLLDEEDEEGSLVVAENYMVPGTPTIYIIDRAGKVTYAYVGRASEEELEKAINAALGQ